MKNIFASFLLLSFVLGLTAHPANAANEEDPVQILLPKIQEAVSYANENNVAKAKVELDEIHETWEKVEDDIKEFSSGAYESIESKLAKAEALLQSNEPNAEEVSKALVELEEAVEQYAEEETTKTTSERPGAEALSGLSYELEEAIESIESADWDHANQEYEEFHEGWESVEGVIRSNNSEIYGDIERNMGLVSASLDASSNTDKAVNNLRALIDSINQYTGGEGEAKLSVPSEVKGIGSLVTILTDVQTTIESDTNDKAGVAAEKMEEFISVWPSIEGEVNTRSSSVYESIENQMTEALGLLLSNPPKTEQAEEVVSKMKSQLTTLSEQTSYTMWDAAIILLREGLEIILILAALLAFLKQSGNADKRRWIWGGAGFGVVASIGLAFLLTSVLSSATSAQNREFIEGITGLIAVVLMFTVGAWLHGKSNIKNWNNYIRQTIGTAVARGSLWSLAGVAFLTVVREGAETIIFYLGMASDITTSSLVTGIGVASLMLVVLGVAILYFSIKVPVRALFLGITVLIYYLAFKFIGESIHAFQVVEKLPVHPISGLFDISWLGVYPTWETSLAQIILLALITAQTFWTRQRQSRNNNQSQSKQQTAQG